MANKLFTQSPHIAPDNAPASTRQRAVYDRPRATAAETAVPVTRKATDQTMPKGNVGSGMGVDDTAAFRAAKATYERHNSAQQQLRDKTLVKAAEAAIERTWGAGAAKEVNAWIEQHGHEFDPVLLAFARQIGSKEMDAQLARHAEFHAGKTPLPTTPSLQGGAKVHALYKGNTDTPAAPAPKHPGEASGGSLKSRIKYSGPKVGR
jgi:hypothetical protein